jgi:hypothetical protein
MGIIDHSREITDGLVGVNPEQKADCHGRSQDCETVTRRIEPPLSVSDPAQMGVSSWAGGTSCSRR